MFGAISRRGQVPYAGILFSGSVLILGVVLDYVLPAQAFLYLAALATVALVITWSMILVTQQAFRRQRLREGTASDLKFPLRGWPTTAYLGIAGMAFVVVMMAFRSETRLALYVAPVWLAALAIGHRLSPQPATVATQIGPKMTRATLAGPLISSATVLLSRGISSRVAVCFASDEF